MKNNFIKALERLQDRFEWAEKNGASERTVKENLIILHGLSEYFECMEKREADMRRAHNSLHERFRKRGLFIEMHGYSKYSINWIDEANIDFLESEVEYRLQNNRPMRASFLSWVDLETNFRVVEKKALADIEAFNRYKEFKTRSSHKAVYSGTLKDMQETQYPYIKFEGMEPTISNQIKFHSFKYEQLN
jgi:hypothetical protein